MNGDGYAALAAVYDDWQGRYGSFSARVLERLLPLLARERPAPRSFLDAGCGTGALLVALAARFPSWRLAGFDQSPEMLARARAKASAVAIAWHELPLGAAVPGAAFDAAGAFFNTLNHLASVADLGRTLGALARALRPGGLLAFDVNNRAGFERWWRGQRVYEGPGWRLEMNAAFDDTAGRAEARVRVVRAGKVTADTVVAERLFSDDEIISALAAAGLQVRARELWAPTSSDVPGATFWTARRVG